MSSTFTRNAPRLRYSYTQYMNISIFRKSSLLQEIGLSARSYLTAVYLLAKKKSVLGGGLGWGHGMYTLPCEGFQESCSKWVTHTYVRSVYYDEWAGTAVAVARRTDSWKFEYNYSSTGILLIIDS